MNKKIRTTSQQLTQLFLTLFIIILFLVNLAFAGIYELIFKNLLAFTDESRSYVSLIANGKAMEEQWSKYMSLFKCASQCHSSLLVLLFGVANPPTAKVLPLLAKLSIRVADDRFTDLVVVLLSPHIISYNVAVIVGLSVSASPV